jgi:SAM-dependent methyltransferase
MITIFPLSILLATSMVVCQGFSPLLVKTTRKLTVVTNTALHEARIAEKVLQNPQWPPEWPYTAQDLSRMDESDDEIFYDSPRLCYHIDDAAVASLTDYYSKIFKDGDDVLDICSSWVSHFPKDWKGGNIVGCGMNEYELSKNERLNSYVVQDLNKNPSLPFEDASFDKVTCVVSVDYLTKPKEIFKEIGRVLKPRGICILSISNRCFPTKAWNLWLRTNDLEHVFIAGSFFHYAGMFEPPSCDDISPNPGRSDPLFIIKAAKKSD